MKTAISPIDAIAKSWARRYERALQKLACLGNGDRYGTSVGNVIAQQALAPEQEGVKG